MEKLNCDGIDAKHIMCNPIVSSFLSAVEHGSMTKETAMIGMINALADENAELREKIKEVVDKTPYPLS